MEVTCLDENDTPPVFDESLKIVLSEAFLPGHRLAKVKATDKDLVYIQRNSFTFVIYKFVGNRLFICTTSSYSLSGFCHQLFTQLGNSKFHGDSGI